MQILNTSPLPANLLLPPPHRWKNVLNCDGGGNNSTSFLIDDGLVTIRGKQGWIAEGRLGGTWEVFQIPGVLPVQPEADNNYVAGGILKLGDEWLVSQRQYYNADVSNLHGVSLHSPDGGARWIDIPLTHGTKECGSLTVIPERFGLGYPYAFCQTEQEGNSTDNGIHVHAFDLDGDAMELVSLKGMVAGEQWTDRHHAASVCFIGDEMWIIGRRPRGEVIYSNEAGNPPCGESKGWVSVEGYEPCVWKFNMDRLADQPVREALPMVSHICTRVYGCVDEVTGRLWLLETRTNDVSPHNTELHPVLHETDVVSDVSAPVDPPVVEPHPEPSVPWNINHTVGLIDNTQHLVTSGDWDGIGAHYESIASRSSVQIQTGDNVQKADPANLARLKLVMDKFPHLLHCVGNHDGKHVDASWWDWTNWITNTDRQPNHTRIIGNTLFIVASHHFAIGQVNWMRDTAAAHDGPWVLVTHGVFKPYKWERWERQVRAITPAPTLVISSHSEDYTMNSGETQMIYQGTPYEYAFAAGDTAYIQRGATLLQSGEPEYFLEFNPNLGCVDVYKDSARTHTVMLSQPIDLTDTPVIEPPPVDPCEDVQAELADAYQTITQQSVELLRSRDQLARIQAITKE